MEGTQGVFIYLPTELFPSDPISVLSDRAFINSSLRPLRLSIHANSTLLSFF